MPKKRVVSKASSSRKRNLGREAQQLEAKVRKLPAWQRKKLKGMEKGRT